MNIDNWQILACLQHPWVPAAAVGLLALLLCLAQRTRNRGQALDGGRTLSVLIILATLVVIWLTWGSSNPSLSLLATIAAAIIPIAFTREQDKEKATSPAVGSSLTFEQYKKDLLEQHANYFQEKQKREEIERKLANLEESYQEKLRLLEESKEKLQQMAGSLPKQQLAEAEEWLAQGDTELAEQLFDRVAEETGQTAAAALFQSGRLAEDRLDYSKAMRNYTAAVAFAPDNPDYLLPAGQMACKMGDYQQAEEWLEYLLVIREQEGKEDIELAFALNSLALVYVDQGRYEKANLLFKRSLKISEKKLGKEHPDIAASLNNLAILYNKQGQYDEAEQQYKRSLKIREKKLGKEHPDVANSLNNLAALYYEQGRYEKAEPLYKRSLKIFEKIFNQEHPWVETTMNNLAALYSEQERYEEAELLYKQSLESREKKFGKEHPDVAQSLNNLAGLYYEQGRYDEAEPLYQQALAILKATFPNGHPNIDVAQENYDELKRKMAGQ